MGFWEGLAKAINEGAKAVTRDPNWWYGEGKQHGRNGYQNQAYFYSGRMNIDQKLVDEYKRGYRDGEGEAKSKRQ